MGAHQVIDYTREDFTRRGDGCNFVFDLIGNHSLTELRRILTPGGTLVLSSGPPFPTIRGSLKALLFPLVSQSLRPLLQTPSGEDLQHLTDLIEGGEVTPVLDRVYPLEEAPKPLAIRARATLGGRTVITVRLPKERFRQMMNEIASNHTSAVGLCSISL